MKPITYQGVTIGKKDNHLYFGEQRIWPYVISQTIVGKVLYLQGKKRCVERKDVICIGPSGGDIVLPKMSIRMVVTANTVMLGKAMKLYHNGKQIYQKTFPIQEGDVLQWGTISLEIQKEYVAIDGNTNDYDTALPTRTPTIKNPPTIYRRSPRNLKKVNAETITIANPPQAIGRQTKHKITTFVPTIITMLMSIGIGVVLGRGLLLLMSATSSVMTLFLNIGMYCSEKKEAKKEEIKRLHTYEVYIIQIRRKMYEQIRYNKNIITYRYPPMLILQKMMQRYDNRIYEKTIRDTDFLELYIGFTKRPIFKIQGIQKEDNWEEDTVKEMAKGVQQQFSKIQRSPVTIDIKASHIGLVGNPNYILPQIQAYMMQLAFFHSYHDIEMICLYSQQHKEVLSYISWYPHMKIKHINVTTSSYQEGVVEQLLGSVYQMLRERQKSNPTHKQQSFSPHIIFFVLEPKHILEHEIMEFLQIVQPRLGYSMLYMAEKQSQLPEGITTVICYGDSNQGCLRIKEGEYVQQNIELLSIKDVDFESNARTLAGIHHEEKIGLWIPKSVTFLEMYDAKKVTDIPILQFWKTNKIYQSMAVPIGKRSPKEKVYLDAHEKMHGSHGLLAGMTGSGKSEIIQTYILSLAVQFHPHDIGFLIIDYKGGGMANLFCELPHLLGTITNLDGDASRRAMLSVQSELKRRQQIFKRTGVNNINAYTRIYKEQKTKEPLPHIFIICDEFAELKKEQPEFMKELISVARMGRSLGIHLLLATQKPTGVIDEQIWSNTNFKLCLKVQDERDSREILKTSDASMITQQGRSYLQVGNNEIYVLFQSAYSGERYDVVCPNEKREAHRVFLIDTLGQRNVINQEGMTSSSKVDNQTTQLQAIISHIICCYRKIKTLPVQKPWLPALSKKIILPKIPVIKTFDMVCEIGIVDKPEVQQQEVYVVDIEKEGNIAYFASTGYGKTMFLSTVIVSLARKNKVEQLHFYILDFGNHGLLSFNSLAHTADYISFNEDEKLDAFKKVIQQEIEKRKQQMMEYQTPNISIYNQTQQEPLPFIVIVVDQMDMVKEKGIEIETFFTTIARDGVSLGIYLIFSCSRFVAVRYATMQQIKTKITGYLFDDGEVGQIMGRSPWKVSDKKGRVLVKTNEVHIAQVYVPIAFEGDITYRKALQQEIISINQNNKGNKAKRIAMLPKVIRYQDIKDDTWKIPEEIALGWNCQTIQMEGCTLGKEPFLIVGPPHCGKTNAMQVIYIQSKGTKYVFDSWTKEMQSICCEEKTVYGYEKQGYQKIWDSIKKKIDANKEQTKEDSTQKKETLDRKNIGTCFIEDIAYFYEVMEEIAEDSSIITEAIACGIHFVVCEDTTKILGLPSSENVFRKTNTGLVLGFGIVPIPFPVTLEEKPSVGYGVLCTKQKKVPMKMVQWK